MSSSWLATADSFLPYILPEELLQNEKGSQVWFFMTVSEFQAGELIGGDPYLHRAGISLVG